MAPLLITLNRFLDRPIAANQVTTGGAKKPPELLTYAPNSVSLEVKADVVRCRISPGNGQLTMSFLLEW